MPSKRLAIRARKCGLAPDQVRLHGPLTHPGFWRKQLAKTELQEELGLNPGVKTCLVLDGGDGDGGLESIADSVGRRLGQDKMESQVGRRSGRTGPGEVGGGGMKWDKGVYREGAGAHNSSSLT